MSASLWGCELKYPLTVLFLVLFPVSLLVRLWVEISRKRNHWRTAFCQPPCEAVSWNGTPMKTFSIGNCQPPCEAVSWNIMAYVCFVGDRCQPPCEAVSWNVLTIVALSDESSSASLWGCELKCFEFLFSLGEIPVSLLVRLWVEIHQRSGSGKAQQGQPPCEAVSWNIMACACFVGDRVSLLVRLWVEMPVLLSLLLPPCSQPPCEAVSWNV